MRRNSLTRPRHLEQDAEYLLELLASVTLMALFVNDSSPVSAEVLLCEPEAQPGSRSLAG
jgi:hypothetical protein